MIPAVIAARLDRILEVQAELDAKVVRLTQLIEWQWGIPKVHGDPPMPVLLRDEPVDGTPVDSRAADVDGRD